MVNKLYRVYRNLNTTSLDVDNASNGKISITSSTNADSAQTRLVVGYADRIVMTNAKFIVSEAGRQRVLREQRKSVHAYIEGYITQCDGLVLRREDNGLQAYTDGLELNVSGDSYTYVTYNPYEHDQFYYWENYGGVMARKNVHGGRVVEVQANGVVRVWGMC